MQGQKALHAQQKDVRCRGKKHCMYSKRMIDAGAKSTACTAKGCLVQRQKGAQAGKRAQETDVRRRCHADINQTNDMCGHTDVNRVI
jgi:hypothetical protein